MVLFQVDLTVQVVTPVEARGGGIPVPLDQATEMETYSLNVKLPCKVRYYYYFNKDIVGGLAFGG